VEQNGNGKALQSENGRHSSHSQTKEEELELQKIEISVLVRRVAELEDELSAARRRVTNAQRQATRAKKTAVSKPPGQKAPRSR
jgi:hypothetical protein